jgi:hypothetical protein
MNKTKTMDMVARLMSNAARVRFGTASVSVKLHEGNVVEVAYSTTENTRERGEPKTVTATEAEKEKNE